MIDFIEICRENGIQLKIKGDKIIVHPVAKLDEVDRDHIRRNKAELMVALKEIGPVCPCVCQGNDMCEGCPEPETFEHRCIKGKR